MGTATRQATIGGMASRANPAFAVGAVAIPLLALGYALTMATIQQHTYIHVMAGVLWTGIDLFMGLVLGPVLGGADIDTRANFFERFTPKMTFLMPTLAVVTIFGGVTLAQRLGKFPHSEPWIAIMSTAIMVPALLAIATQFNLLRDWRFLAVFGVVTVAHGGWLATTLPAFAMTDPWIAAAIGLVVLLSVIGFGIILPGEVKIFLELNSQRPDTELIGSIGMRNAKLGGLQGLLQLSVVFVMVSIRFWPG
jgi:hypothetical protein